MVNSDRHFNSDRRNLLKGIVAGTAAGMIPGIAGAATEAGPKMLSKGVTPASFSRAVGELRAIVGAEWVFADTESVLPYTIANDPDPGHLHEPIGAVAPASTEEVQQIIKVANKYKLPVWPVSTGKNIGYGTTLTATPGQMILDLKRMNRIIEVDAELGTALIEPGVTYPQLSDYLIENKIPLWIDCPSPGPITGPVGNSLERGGGYTPYGDHFSAISGMEVVLPDGQVIRTGFGVANSKVWQAFKYGWGPYIDGLFSQSNFGVVTKMGLCLMAAPPATRTFMVRLNKESDIANFVTTTRDLQLHGVIQQEVFALSPLYELAQHHRRDEIWDQPGPIPDDVVMKKAKEEGLSAWNCYFSLYGTEQVFALFEPMVRAAYGAIGGEVFSDAEMKGNRYFDHQATLMRGGLTLEEKGIIRWRGEGGLSWFCPFGPAKGQDAVEMIALAKQILTKYGFDYTAGLPVIARAVGQVVAILFDKGNPEEEKRAAQCNDELIVEFCKRGYLPYRTGVRTMALVAQQLFDKSRADFNHRIKHAIDPNGILAPGKSGIL